MPKFDVRCIQGCWDSKRCIKYYPGDRDDIDPREPIAMYFDGWPDGTEVYFKERCSKDTPIKTGFRMVGKPPAKEPEPERETVETCEVCGEFQGSHKQVATHRRFCLKRQEDMQPTNMG